MEQGTSADDCLPKFFKMYLPGVSGDDLELPVSLNSFLPKSLPRTVTVRSIYGKIWRMALRKCGGDIEKYALVNGWKRIVKDEDMARTGLLEFEFDGARCFNFCIYEASTMCKRLRRSSEQSEEETRASDEVFVCDDDDDDDAASAAVDAAVDAAADDDDGDEADDDQRQYLDDRSNPSFPVTLNQKRRSQLRISSKVIKDYRLNFGENVTVVDPLVKKFGTLENKIKIQLNGAVFLKGYEAILRRNNVKSRDKMICELKKTGDNNLVHTIKFHIISR